MSKAIEQIEAEVEAATESVSAASMEWFLIATLHPDDHKRVSHACQQWTERVEWLKTVVAARDALKKEKVNHEV